MGLLAPGMVIDVFQVSPPFCATIVGTPGISITFGYFSDMGMVSASGLVMVLGYTSRIQ